MRIISINYSLRRQNIFSLRLSNLSFSQWKWINIKMKWKIQETKLHTIPRFPAGSFAVHIGDHFRSGDHLRSNLGIISDLGIVCVGGSFAALYSSSELRNDSNYILEGVVKFKIYLTIAYKPASGEVFERCFLFFWLQEGCF